MVQTLCQDDVALYDCLAVLRRHWTQQVQKRRLLFAKSHALHPCFLSVCMPALVVAVLIAYDSECARKLSASLFLGSQKQAFPASRLWALIVYIYIYFFLYIFLHIHEMDTLKTASENNSMILAKITCTFSPLLPGSYLGELLHRAPKSWTIRRKKGLEGENYLTPPCKNMSFLSPWPKNKSYTHHQMKLKKKSKSFFGKHIHHISSTNLFEWRIQPHWSFPYRASVQQGASEAHGFRLQTDKEWPQIAGRRSDDLGRWVIVSHHVMKTCYPTIIP